MADEIIGDYRLARHILTGQSSQVWEVVELNSGRHFAMKLLLPEKAKDSVARNFLFHEAEVGKELAHPNIIRIVKIDRSPTTPNFVMEFFPSGSLKQRITRAAQQASQGEKYLLKAGETREDQFIRERALDILKQTATGLAFMNASGWVHRDVKPDNILVNGSGDVRIIDFALAERIQTGFWSRLFGKRKKAQGTRSYMSPEQIRGLALDGRADIYSFGASAFEIVTGRPPFRAGTSQELLTKQIAEKPASPQQFNKDLTDEFATLVLRMLAKKKEQRPKDFHEVLMALRALKVYKE